MPLILSDNQWNDWISEIKVFISCLDSIFNCTVRVNKSEFFSNNFELIMTGDGLNFYERVTCICDLKYRNFFWSRVWQKFGINVTVNENWLFLPCNRWKTQRFKNNKILIRHIWFLTEIVVDEWNQSLNSVRFWCFIVVKIWLPFKV